MGRGGEGELGMFDGRIWWVCGCVLTGKRKERTKMMCMGVSHSVCICVCVWMRVNGMIERDRGMCVCVEGVGI